MKTKSIKFKILTLLLLASIMNTYGQNWNKLDSTLNSNITDSVWRTGPVLISDYISKPDNNKLGIVTKYDTTNNRGLFVSLNEPDWFNVDSDSTRVGLAKKADANHTALIATNYANFYDSLSNTDVHNSTAEISYTRGMSDLLGFRDGGSLEKAASLKLLGVFGNNGRDYSNDQFDLLNLRFFTSITPNNQAQIDKFYGIRLEDFRGVNLDIINQGWGVYMKPNTLNNYFGGKVGIGIEAPSAALSIVSDTLNPLSLDGLKVDITGTDLQLLSIDNDGVVHQKSLQSLNENFQAITGDIILDNDTFLYVHKGSEAYYTLPPANTRTGKTWKIVNAGTGTVTFSNTFLEGNETRNTLLNKPGNYSLELFSDGTNYIAL